MYEVFVDSYFYGLEHTGKKFESIDDAEKECEKIFDEGTKEDFVIKDETGWQCRIQAHKLMKRECPECKKEIRPKDMSWTYDCHGIPFRMVCPKCHEKIMGRRGYDGEYYTSVDECIENDY